MTETAGYLGATNLPHRGVEDFRETLRSREAKLAAAKKQRDTILNDMSKAAAASDAGDQMARATLRDLAKADLAAGRLVGSLAGEVAESRKRLAMAEEQAGLIAANRAAGDAAALPRNKLFESVCPDGRCVIVITRSKRCRRDCCRDIARLGRYLARTLMAMGVLCRSLVF